MCVRWSPPHINPLNHSSHVHMYSTCSTVYTYICTVLVPMYIRTYVCTVLAESSVCVLGGAHLTSCLSIVRLPRLPQLLGVAACSVAGVCRVDNRGCRLAMDKAVKRIVLCEDFPEDTKEADFFNYLLLVWKEGMSLKPVVENGEFPKQVIVAWVLSPPRVELHLHLSTA